MQYISEETNIQDTKVKVRENRRGNDEWTIQSHWQHCAHKKDTGRRQNESLKKKRKAE